MPFLAAPRTFLIGYTNIDWSGLLDYLKHTENEDFFKSACAAETQGVSQGEILCSFYAKLCYKSLTLGQNLNVTRVRDIPGNIQNALEQGHGSVFEHAWINFVTTNCSRVFTHELVRHRVGTAFCLAGDTVVWSGSKVNGRWDGVRKSWPIAKLYEWSQDPLRKGRLKLITVRCLVGDKFVQAKIADVVQSGVKPIYRVTLDDGRHIRCSQDHLFLARIGWTPVRSLQVGDELVTNGRGTGSTLAVETERRLKIAESKQGNRNPQWLGDAVGTSGAYRRARKYKTDVCARCGAGEDLHIHHMNRNILDNSPGNLETLCNSCHQKLHNAEDGNPNALLPEWRKIISIEPDGEEMTYDLAIANPAHNFVANGIVTHNSQTSGRYVRLDKIGVVWDPILDPCHDLAVKALQQTEDTIYLMECKVGLRVPNPQQLDAAAADYIYNREQGQFDAAEDVKWVPNDKLPFSTKKKLTSAIRRFAPNGQVNEIGWSINLRALRHIIQLRTAAGAEWEIRKVFNQVYDLVKEKFPLMFFDAQEEVVDGLRVISGMKVQPYEEKAS